MSLLLSGICLAGAAIAFRFPNFVVLILICIPTSAALAIGIAAFEMRAGFGVGVILKPIASIVTLQLGMAFGVGLAAAAEYLKTKTKTKTSSPRPSLRPSSPRAV